MSMEASNEASSYQPTNITIMAKLRIERGLIKRSCETFYKMEREFKTREEAWKHLCRYVSKYMETEDFQEMDEIYHGYRLTLYPSYHQVQLEVVD